MKTTLWITAALLLSLAAPLQAQQPQIPTLQVRNQTLVTGAGLVKIVNRGSFKVEVEVKCDVRQKRFHRPRPDHVD